MSRVLSQSRPKATGKTVPPNARPVAIQYSPGKPATVAFADGPVALSSCLRCHDTPCMTLAPAETGLSAFPDFPADRRDNVCASEAMTRNPETGAPTIDHARCVLCGVC